jgi:hypothetical protein
MMGNKYRALPRDLDLVDMLTVPVNALAVIAHCVTYVGT